MTLGTELLVSGFVYGIIYDGYRRNRFHRRTAFFVLGYEVLFNISYMLSRLLENTPGRVTQVLTPYETSLAIFHGVFSLVMFLTLVAFFIAAARGYGRGENYFRMRPRLTILFALAWLISVLSGVAFFVNLYLI